MLFVLQIRAASVARGSELTWSLERERKRRKRERSVNDMSFCSTVMKEKKEELNGKR